MNLKVNLNVLREISEIYFPTQKEVIKTKQYSKKSVDTISYKIKFIDSNLWQVHYQILQTITQKEPMN